MPEKNIEPSLHVTDWNKALDEEWLLEKNGALSAVEEGRLHLSQSQKHHDLKLIFSNFKTLNTNFGTWILLFVILTSGYP